jgi:hypothetical protein
MVAAQIMLQSFLDQRRRNRDAELPDSPSTDE